ncbi:DHA2 family efflux MFS transporter permease subunit [Agrobacterium vitis]|uniref:DHA2 family efflux MFS transporter permease subunit n=1 Tax=Agrobacterium vitis TaxID=373 RepID=UPI001572ADC4|nr:DHA2 family efflux MFS transporter permease subunit [Agrobacterium vitis]NSZ19816.1 DHA2 family efflux MFS transporter permease subunit [Agrobacterium vitis]QZO07273.1 DHA2 family efflux MFS transporter permease subunit [Agrobacterium vitis]UJL91035.1 DHA2 family efflux MFS transporter permease subunit [Agrobacterium vitis]
MPNMHPLEVQPIPEFGAAPSLIVGAALFMQMLDGTVVASALPAIARSFGESPVRLNAIITIYLLTAAATIPVSGWLADRFGARSTFIFAICIFTISSGICGLTDSFYQLLAARCLQGFGGAMMVPVGRIIILRNTPKSQLLRAMSLLTLPAIIGPIIGPIIAGALITYASWRWIFIINIPIGFFGIILTLLYIKHNARRKGVSFDAKGFALTGVGLPLIIVGMFGAAKGAAGADIYYASLIVGIVLLALYVYILPRISNPILDLRLFTIYSFNAATVAGGLCRAGFGALPFLLALLLQIGFHLSAMDAGLISFTSAIGALMSKPILQHLIRKFGIKNIIILMCCLNFLIIILYGMFKPGIPYYIIVSGLVFGGFVRSCLFTSLNALAYLDISDHQSSKASGLSSVMQQVFTVVGVGIASLVLQILITRSGTANITPDQIGTTFIVMAIISIISIFWFIGLPRDTGSELKINK